MKDVGIDDIESILPQANCGGCGFPGCEKFARACLKEMQKNNSLGDLACPVGGEDVTEQIKDLFGPVPIPKQQKKEDKESLGLENNCIASIRLKPLKNGRQSVYLDVKLNGETKSEFLKLFIIPETDALSVEQNKKTLATAEKIRVEKLISLGIEDWDIEKCYSFFKKGHPTLEKYTQLNDELRSIDEQLEIGKIVKPTFESDGIHYIIYGLGLSILLFVARCVYLGVPSFGDSILMLCILSAITIIVFYFISIIVKKYQIWHQEKEWEKENLDEYLEYRERAEPLERRQIQLRNAIKLIKPEVSGLQNSSIINLQKLLPLKQISLPIPEGSLNKNNFKVVGTAFVNIIDNQKKLAQANDLSMRTEIAQSIADIKLNVFYNVSLRSIAPANAFKGLLPENIDFTPSTFRELETSERNQETEISSLQNCKNLLDDNKMAPLLNEFEDIRRSDVTGFFGIMTDRNKLLQQTKNLKQLCIYARDEYKELDSIRKILNESLDRLRVYAYQNTYLGIELLNYVRTGAGGGSLAKQEDMVFLKSLKLPSISFDENVTSNIFGKELAGYFKETIKSKDFKKAWSSDPKIAAGAVAVGAIGAVIDAYSKHCEEVNQQKKIQAEIIEQMDKIITGYSEGQGQLYRIIELGRSIVEANKGFLAVYQPLSDKVFKQHKTLEMAEIQQLARAIKCYKEISGSKI